MPSKLDDLTLAGKVVVVTGAAGLLGRALAHSIATRGGTIVVSDIDEDAGRRVADELAHVHSGLATPAKLDITCPDSVEALIAAVVERHGRIDAVVNNAYPRNKHYGRKLEDVTFDDFSDNVRMHLGGYFLVAQQFGLHFRKQGDGGIIINMSSVYGVTAPRFHLYEGTPMTMPVEYAAIKSAVIHLTRYFAQYFKGDGIRVNCVSPGGVLDGQADAFVEKYRTYCATKGMLDPGDIANVVTFLLSDQAKYINGQNIVVDDGFSL